MGNTVKTYRVSKGGNIIADGIPRGEVAKIVGKPPKTDIDDYALKGGKINGYKIERSKVPSEWVRKQMEEILKESQRQGEFFGLIGKIKVGSTIEINEPNVLDSHFNEWYLYTVTQKTDVGLALKSKKGRNTFYTFFQLYEFYKQKGLGV